MTGRERESRFFPVTHSDGGGGRVRSIVAPASCYRGYMACHGRRYGTAGDGPGTTVAREAGDDEGRDTFSTSRKNWLVEGKQVERREGGGGP